MKANAVDIPRRVSVPTNIITDQNLKATERIVLLSLYAICRKASRNDEFSISYQTLSELSGFTRPTVVRAVKALENKGLISVEHNPNVLGFFENRYRLNV